MKLNEHVAQTLDASEALQQAREIQIGTDYSSVILRYNDDDERWHLISNGQEILSDSSQQDALTMACAFYVGRCDMYDNAPKLLVVRGLREVLASLDEVLAKRDTTAQQLWNVLTALRGPDFTDEMLKEVSTSPLRAIAFPQTYEACKSYSGHGNANGASFDSPTKYDEAGVRAAESQPLCTTADLSYKTRGHFVGHARKAYIALTAAGMVPQKSQDDDIDI